MTKRFVRVTFNTLAAASFVMFLLGITGSTMILWFRWLHFLQTGDFIILRYAPPDAITSYEQAEMATIVITVSSTILPLIWLFDRHKAQHARRRIESGQCPRCGYNLRATPDRCPECGTIPTKKDVVST
jgi:hypothetical protein